MKEDDLKAEIIEGDEYLVIGIVLPRAVTERPSLWARLLGRTPLLEVKTGERWATLYRADGARQAEDLARAAVASKLMNGNHFDLHVAGVVELDPEGKLKLADQDYARFVDPDAEVV